MSAADKRNSHPAIVTKNVEKFEPRCVGGAALGGELHPLMHVVVFRCGSRFTREGGKENGVGVFLNTLSSFP